VEGAVPGGSYCGWCDLKFKAPLIRVWVMVGQVANAGKDMLGASEQSLTVGGTAPFLHHLPAGPESVTSQFHAALALNVSPAGQNTQPMHYSCLTPFMFTLSSGQGLLTGRHFPHPSSPIFYLHFAPIFLSPHSSLCRAAK
jgi:hypothetical protein